jgi:hypothetical protein
VKMKLLFKCSHTETTIEPPEPPEPPKREGRNNQPERERTYDDAQKDT